METFEPEISAATNFFFFWPQMSLKVERNRRDRAWRHRRGRYIRWRPGDPLRHRTGPPKSLDNRCVHDWPRSAELQDEGNSWVEKIGNHCHLKTTTTKIGHQPMSTSHTAYHIIAWNQEKKTRNMSFGTAHGHFTSSGNAFGSIYFVMFGIVWYIAFLTYHPLIFIS